MQSTPIQCSAATVWCMAPIASTAPEFTPMKALQTAIRGEGVELVDLFSRMELLALQSRNREGDSADVLYTTCAAEDASLIPELHNCTTEAIRRDKSRPWANKLADTRSHRIV